MKLTNHWYKLPAVGCQNCSSVHKGYKEVVYEDILPVTEECSCLTTYRKALRTQHLVQRTIFTKKMWEDATRENCEKYIKEYQVRVRPHLLEPINNGDSIYICGRVNSGKTLLAMYISRVFMEHGLPVLFYPFGELLSKLRATKDETFLHELLEERVLVLDDLGTQGSSSWNDELIQNVINGRYVRQKQTIITSNLLLGELGDSTNQNRFLSKIQRSYTSITL